MAEWHEFLVKRAGPARGLHTKLPANLLDATPFNLVSTPSGLEIIDQEWTLETGDVSVGWVLFRGLYWFLVAYGEFSRCRKKSWGQWGAFIQKQFALFGYSLTGADLRVLANREAGFQEAILEGNAASDFTTGILQGLGPMTSLLRLGRNTASRTIEIGKRLRQSLRNNGSHSAG